MSTDAESREDRCEVVVEIPRGSRNKYEATDDGTIWFDRRLGGPAGFPGDYGYVVGLDGEDGDALDALVTVEELDAFFAAYQMLGVREIAVLGHQGHDEAVALLTEH